jgi:hypothetical protein
MNVINQFETSHLKESAIISWVTLYRKGKNAGATKLSCWLFKLGSPKTSSTILAIGETQSIMN